ncbi:MAG: hypothetical protein AAB815_02365, partial [Patescibacteria group bacterium]
GFVLTCYGASRNTAESVIDGFRPPAHSEPILIGPSNPNESIDAKQVKKFFDEIKANLEPNKPVHAKIIGWRFSPKVQEYIKTLSKYVSENKLFAEDEQTPLIDIELVPLRSNRFRERVLSRYPEIQEAEFFLRFPEAPVIGDIRVKKVNKLEYKLEAIDALSTEEDGWLVNCQWDFDYQEGHFSANKEYILSRGKVRDKQRGEIFKAILGARHTFNKPGKYTVACKVQDNLAGEIIFSKLVKI